MTDEEFVKSAYPEAECKNVGPPADLDRSDERIPVQFIVSTCPQKGIQMAQCIGYGLTKEQAWSTAATFVRAQQSGEGDV